MAEWRPIVSTPRYEVSDEGQVRNARTKRLIKQRTERYKRVGLLISTKPHHCQMFLVHRLVLEAFVGPCPDGMETRHRNGIETDNVLTNLEWATHTVNNQDKHTHGTMAIGEKQGLAVMTEAKVIELRNLYWTRNVTQRQLAARFGIAKSTVVQIINRRTWTHV